MADRSVVVRLIADTGSYEQGMRRSAASTRDFERAGRSSIITLRQLGTIAGGFVVGSVIKAGIEFDALKQRSQAAFTTILGSAAGAKKELGDLYGTFKNNPFGYPQILKSAQQLLAMGTNAKDLVRTVRDISDATAAVGGNADVLDRVALAIGQMHAKGTVQAEELRQLAENGIPAWQMLAKEIGVSVPEAMKMVQKRQVDSVQGVDALLSGIEDRFGGATANLKDTWTGTLTAFKTAAVAAGGEIVKPIMRIGTDGMHALEPLFRGLGQLGTEFASLPNPIQNTGLAMAGVALFSGRLNAAWASTRASMGPLREAWAAARQDMTEMGGGLRSVRILAGVAAPTVRALGSSMLSAFGGPIGLAITGVTLGLSIWQQRMQDDAQAAAQTRAEIDNLSAALDVNTGKLNDNGKAQVDKFLASQDGSGPSPVDQLKAMGVSADLVRRALLGNAQAWKQVQVQIMASGNKGQWFGSKMAFLGELSHHVDELGTAMSETSAEMRLKFPDAARAANTSSVIVATAFDEARRKGTTLKSELRGVGLDASQVSAILRVLGSDATNTAGSFGGAANALATMQKNLQTAAAGFSSIGGAWDSAVTLVNPTGGASKAKKQQTDPDRDPAVRKAAAAMRAQGQAAKARRIALKEALKAANEQARSDDRAADSADKYAKALKKTADAAMDAAKKAKDAVKKASDTKQQADQDAHDAAALAAAVRAEAAHAGTADAAAWAAAQKKATSAVTTTTRTQTAATKALTAAQADAKAKRQAAISARDEARVAAQAAASQRRMADASEHAAKVLANHLQRIENQDNREHAKLLKARNKAEDQARKKTEAANEAVSDSYGGLADKIKPSLDQYLDELQKTVTDQITWKNNLITLAAEVPPGVALQLAKLGPQAAPLVQELVDGTKTQLARFVELFGHTGDSAAHKVSTQLSLGIPLIAAVGKRLGDKAAARLAAGIREGKTTISAAITALQGHLDKDSLQMKLGIKNKEEIATELDNLLHHRIYKLVPWKGPGGEKGFQIGSVKGYAEGGWITGGSGRRDDVAVGMNGGRGGLMAMGGEFMVKRSIAQAYKPFFEELNRTGRMPAGATPARQPHMIVMPRPAPSRHVVNNFLPGSIVQLPGQSARDLVLEIDRLADLGAGP